MGDLNKRRGRVLGMNPDNTGIYQIVEADVPITGALRICHHTSFHDRWKPVISLMQFARYEQAPGDVQEREIEARASKVDKGEE